MVIAESVWTIVLVSLERFLIIKRPVQSRTYLRKTVCLVLIGVTWFLSCVIMVPLLINRKYENMAPYIPMFLQVNNQTYQMHNITELPYICLEKWPDTYKKLIFDVVLFLVIYVIPTTIITCFYCSSGCSLLRGIMPGYHADSATSNSAKVVAERRKIAIMLLVLALVFALSWLPYQVGVFYMDYLAMTEQEDNDRMEMVGRFVYIALMIGHSNCAQNPLVYFLLNSRFRKGFYTMCQRGGDSGNMVSQQCMKRLLHHLISQN